jgi:hypothetical protein
MKLSCPRCKGEILRDNVNMREGIAHCASCQEYFKIADFLREDEELRRIKKPGFSKVMVNHVAQAHLITIPPDGWNGTAIFVLFFALICNSLSIAAILSADSGESALFYSLFLLIGLMLILSFLFIVKGVVHVHFNAKKIEVIYDILGFRYRKRRRSVDLDKITESVAYTSNYQPVYGIGLLFKKEPKIVFGSGLKEEERKWLIGELYEMKTIYQNPKV